MAPVQKSNAPLIMSILSTLSCCAPLGLVGAALGYRDMSRAKAAGSRADLKSTVAVVLGVLSIFELVGVLAWHQHDNNKRLGQASAALSQLSSADRVATTVSQKTACALATALVLETQTPLPLAVKCAGSVESHGDFGSIAQVRLMDSPPSDFTVCLARRDRWFATVALRVGQCPNQLPAVPADAGAGDDAEEAGIRSQMVDVARQAEVDGVMQHLVQVRSAVEHDAAAPATCPSFGVTGDARSVPIVELAVLPGPPATSPVGTDASWNFLDTKGLLEAINAHPSLADRHLSAMDALRSLGSQVLVLDTRARAMPKPGTEGFTGGFYLGELAVVDMPSGKVACKVPLVFKSSESIKTGGGVSVGLKVGPAVTLGGTGLGDALAKDFGDNYATALTTALGTATKGQLSADL